jgi:DNA processing protein
LPPEPAALAVAICGTRKASPIGLGAAEFFARELARVGAVIVTGGSHGIEAMAVRTALDVGGRCAVVLPCGPDVIYPEDHRRLYRSVAERGAVLSPFPLGQRVLPGNFAERNRFLAALCAAVVVVEAPRDSGSLTIANAANDEGRHVFVVPGPYNAPSFAGNHDLLRLGATVATTPFQVLDDLGQSYEIQTASGDQPQLSKEQERLLELFSTEPMRLDEIARRAGRPAPEIAAELTLLELGGVLMRAAGGAFCLRS